jgi:catalase
MHGYGSHTFAMINDKKRKTLGKIPFQKPAGNQKLQQ